MTIGDQIEDEKLQYDNNREAAKIYHPYHQAKLTSMNILLETKYYHLILPSKTYNKTS